MRTSAKSTTIYELQRPEGKLLAIALERSGLSARKAAESMDISDTRLRHIINGYQPVGRGQVIEVVAPTGTLAKIAMVLKVDATDLETAGRPDAAKLMRMTAEEAKPWRPKDRIVNEAAWAEINEWINKYPVGTWPGPPPMELLVFFENEDIFDFLKEREAGRRSILRELHQTIRDLRTQNGGSEPSQTDYAEAADDDERTPDEETDLHHET